MVRECIYTAVSIFPLGDSGPEIVSKLRAGPVRHQIASTANLELPKRHQERLKSGQERSNSVQELSKRLPRVIQEAPKRPSEGFRVEDAIWNSF